MRHLVGLVLALILSAAIFVGGGWGIFRVDSYTQHGTSLTSIPGLLGVAAMLGTGLLLGILLVAPGISPLAAGLPGLGLLGWSALLLLSVSRAVKLIPLSGYDIAAGFHLMLTSGLLALLGMAMVLPLFVPSRWRRRVERYDDFAPQPATGLLQ